MRLITFTFHFFIRKMFLLMSEISSQKSFENRKNVTSFTVNFQVDRMFDMIENVLYCSRCHKNIERTIQNIRHHS